jgi:hypothetical protein
LATALLNKSITESSHFDICGRVRVKERVFNSGLLQLVDILSVGHLIVLRPDWAKGYKLRPDLEPSSGWEYTNMIPIYEQGQGKGIGYGFSEFLKRFDKICEEHVKSHRAKAFAFIFYDFHDEDIRRILKDQGVFAQLDRLASTELSVFYLHTTGSENTVAKFNKDFLSKLQVHDAAPPCVVFFKLTGDGIGDLVVAQLDSADLLHGFHELYEVIRDYVQHDVTSVPQNSRYLKWFKSSASFVGKEVFESALKVAVEVVKKSVMGG